MARHKDVNWDLAEGNRQGGVNVHTWEAIHTALLMDIRDELKRLNELLHCSNTLTIPRTLKRIDRRLATKLPLKAK